MMNRVCFRRAPTFREKVSALFAPRAVRRAVQIAQTISFEPDISQQVREAAILKLRNHVGYDHRTAERFQSAEALAVLAVMDTVREIIPGLARQARHGDALIAAHFRRELNFNRSILAICALYMRRSGHMNRQTLGDSLYKAAAAIETIYGPLPSRNVGTKPSALIS